MPQLDVRPLDGAVLRAAEVQCPACGGRFVVSSSSAVMRRFVEAAMAVHSC